ncbi:nitrous oxide-stimulated promoter family protein [Desulfopila aestuarii]|uniref:nitrous oxide-stimulated promoter family protein n=1 Tax=Desulfopila aestuarii TaxID=231440 RepID=UPI0022866FC9|nr:nitrous oxide-stimulated promoter family protein [Desulfopila aestuarii]
MRRELHTIRAMIAIYCKFHHHYRHTLCPDCFELLNYAEKRLKHCPFQENKPTCGNCSIHCYKPEMQEKIRIVMRFAGPRMIYLHPLMAIRHLLDSRRKADQFPCNKKVSTDHNTTDLK